MFSIKGNRYYVLEGHPTRHSYGTLIVKVSKTQTRATGRRRVYFRLCREPGGAEMGEKPDNCLEEAFQAKVVCLGPLPDYYAAVAARSIVEAQRAEIDAAVERAAIDASHEEVAAAKAEALELKADASCTKCGSRYASRGFSYTECPECHRQGYSFRGDVVVNSIGRPAAKDACMFIGEPWTPEQEEAYEDHVSEAVAQYKRARANRSEEQRAEEAFEMRAAFGPGEEVVNIITGERTRT